MKSLERRAGVCVAAASLAVCLGGCPTAGTRVSTPLASEVEASSQSEFGLAPGDTFDIRVWDEATLSGPYKVAPDGTFEFPLLGTIDVKGKLPQDVAKELKERLRKGYLRNPDVMIIVKEQSSKKIFILGQVSKPGTITYSQNLSIVEAIGQVGGFTPMAMKNGTTITRVEQGKKVSMVVPVADISEGKAGNYFLRPGDIVLVPERIF
jgi:protein involved in polysaccharide export with SLBB domain